MAYLRDLLVVLVTRDMRIRYKRSVVGIGWSLINPLAELLILGFVFGRLLPQRILHFQVFLFTGLLTWNWFSNSLSSASVVIVNNAQLVQQPGFPLRALPIATVTTHFVHFLLAIPILAFFLLWEGLGVSATLVAALLVMAIQFLFSLSLSYYLAAIHVVFGDTQYLLDIALRIGFFVSGIFFDPATVATEYQPLFRLNPIVVLVDAYRTIFIDSSFPDPGPLIGLFLVSLGLLAGGLRVFDRASESFAEEI